MPRIPHLRWWIVSLIFFASVLNYVDRQALSILAPTIQKDLALSNEDYASVLNWFLIAYTIALILSGKIVDRFGVRWSLALFVGWWSISNILTGFARSATSLGVCRFFLGLVPRGSLAFAFGVIAAGSSLGGLMMNKAVGSLVTNLSYDPAFGFLLLLHPLAWLLAWQLRRRAA